MAIISLRKRKKRKKKRRHPVSKKRPQPKPQPKPKPKPAPPPQPAPKPPTQPAPPPTTPGSTPGATTYQPVGIAATQRERLYLNRFGTGFTQRALARLRAAGSPEAWLEAQLAPQTVTESAKVAAVDGWFDFLRRTPLEKYNTDRAKTKAAWSTATTSGTGASCAASTPSARCWRR